MADRENMEMIGSMGLRQFGGFIREEFINDLKGQKKFQIFREMKQNDATVGAMLRAIDLAMRQVPWKIVPASKDNADQRRAEFLKEVKEDMQPGWDVFLSDVTSMIPYGIAPHEMIFKRREGTQSRFDDGRIGIKDLPIRRQETIYKWEFDENERPKTLIQQTDTGGNFEIPVDKLLLFKPDGARGNPEGSSVLRTAYRAWYFKKRIQEIEAIGIERDLAGLPFAWVPPEILSADATVEQTNIRDRIRDIVRNVRRDEQEGIVYPQVWNDQGEKDFDFELLSSGGERQFDTNEVIQRWDERITMTALADFLLIGHEQVGSFALANSKTNFFTLALGAWLDIIEDKLNRKLVPTLFRLNGQTSGPYPKFKHGDVEGPTLEDLGQYINNVAKGGFNFSEEEAIRDKVLDMAGLPREEDGPPEQQPERDNTEQPDDQVGENEEPNTGLSIGQSTNKGTVIKKLNDHRYVVCDEDENNVTICKRDELFTV